MRVNWLVDRLHEQGANVTTYGNWQSVGGSLTEVRGWFLHHTASGPSSDGAPDINYIWKSGGLVPEYNAYVQRSGLITVGCSGRANHAGKGGDTGGSDSGRKPIPWIPPNGANSYTVCLALANNGVGEPYTMAQENAALMFARAVIAGSGCSNDHGLAHFEWTKRKIDPAGQSRWASGASSWNMNAFRADVGSTAPSPSPTPPSPQPTPEEDEDMIIQLRAKDGSPTQQAAVFWWDGRQIGWVRSQSQSDLGRLTVYNNSEPFLNLTADEIQMMIDNGWVGGNVPPGFGAPKDRGVVDTGVS